MAEDDTNGSVRGREPVDRSDDTEATGGSKSAHHADAVPEGREPNGDPDSGDAVEQELEGLLARITGKLDTAPDAKPGPKRAKRRSRPRKRKAAPPPPVDPEAATGAPDPAGDGDPHDAEAKPEGDDGSASTPDGDGHDGDPSEPSPRREGSRRANGQDAATAADATAEPSPPADDSEESAARDETGENVEDGGETGEGRSRGEDASASGSTEHAPDADTGGPAEDADVADQPDGEYGPSWPESWGPKPDDNVEALLSEMLKRVGSEAGSADGDRSSGRQRTRARDGSGRESAPQSRSRTLDEEDVSEAGTAAREVVPVRTQPAVAPILSSVLEAADLTVHEATLLHQGRPLPIRSMRRRTQPENPRLESNGQRESKPIRKEPQSLHSMISHRLRSVRIPDEEPGYDPGGEASLGPSHDAEMAESPPRPRRDRAHGGEDPAPAGNATRSGRSLRPAARGRRDDPPTGRIPLGSLPDAPHDGSRSRMILFAGAAAGGALVVAATAVVAVSLFPGLFGGSTTTPVAQTTEPEITVERTTTRPAAPAVPSPEAPAPVAPDPGPQPVQRSAERVVPGTVSNEVLDSLSTFQNGRPEPGGLPGQPAGGNGSVISVERTTVNPQRGSVGETAAVSGEIEQLQREAVGRIGRFQINEAETLLNEILTRSPNYTRALSARAKVKVLRRDFVGAEADYQAALRLNPEFLSARLGRVEALIGQGRSDEALLQVTPIINANAREAAAFDLRARAYATVGDLERARADCATLGELVGAAFITDWCVGVAAKEAGDKGEALQAFTRSLQSAEQTFILHRQLYLRFRGHYSGEIDGDVGPGTMQAVAACIEDRAC